MIRKLWFWFALSVLFGLTVVLTPFALWAHCFTTWLRSPHKGLVLSLWLPLATTDAWYVYRVTVCAVAEFCWTVAFDPKDIENRAHQIFEKASKAMAA